MRRMYHTVYMRLSCIICSAVLIALGICGGVWAIWGFDLLNFLCLANGIAVKCAMAAGGASALFLTYALLVLRPYRGLK